MSEFVRPQGYELFDYTTAYRAGNGVYLAEGQTFEEVVNSDKAILEAEGITQEQVGSSLRKLFATWDDFIEIRDPQPQYPLPGIMLTRQVYLLGQELCPYVPGLSSGVNWHVFVDEMGNGNKAVHPIDGPTFVSDMMPEMIAKTGFFEGDVFFGIDPNWAVAMHRLVEKYQPQPYIPTLTKDAWDYVHSKVSREEAEYRDIEDNQIFQDELAPGITILIAPGDIAPWGWSQFDHGRPHTPTSMEAYDRQNPYYWAKGGKERLEAKLFTRTALWALFVNNTEEDFRLPPGFTMYGLPFDKYVSEIRIGKSYGRYLPGKGALKQIA
jgi:hypothetical protein